MSRLRRFFGWYDNLPIDPDLAPDDPAEPAFGHHPSAVHVHRRSPRVLLAIGFGGFLGTLGRYALAVWWPTHGGTFPLTTFVINVSGAFALGAVMTFIVERRTSNQYLRPFVCVGILGGWTTMSTLATEFDVLVKDGHWLTALAYVGATLAVSLVATTLGIALTRRRGAAQ